MAHLITFRTARFDVAAEDPNPINPIPGQGVLRWLGPQLTVANCKVTDPSPEDWGWFMDVEFAGAHYLVGASSDPEGTSGELEWMVQVEMHRSLREKVFGQNKMAVNDPLVSLIERIIRADPQNSGVTSAPA